MVLKALIMFHVLLACYFMCAGAGACLNPALGMAQTTHMIAMNNSFGFIGGNANGIWVYMGAPIIGAILAALFFGFY